MLVVLAIIWLSVSASAAIVCVADGVWIGLLLAPILTAIGLTLLCMVLAILGKIAGAVAAWVEEGDYV
jgi:hypothetical protein